MAGTPPFAPYPDSRENDLMSQILGQKLDSAFDGPGATGMNLLRSINGAIGGSPALILYSKSEMADFAAPSEKIVFGVVLISRATGQLVPSVDITEGTCNIKRYDSTGALISNDTLAMTKKDGYLYCQFTAGDDGDQHVATLNNNNSADIGGTSYTVPPHSEVAIVSDLGSLPNIESMTERIAKGMDVRTLYGMDAVPKMWQRGRDIYVSQAGAGDHIGLDGFNNAMSCSELRTRMDAFIQDYDRIWFKMDSTGFTFESGTGLPGSMGLRIRNKGYLKIIKEPSFANYDWAAKDYKDWLDGFGAMRNSDPGASAVITLENINNILIKSMLIFGPGGDAGLPDPNRLGVNIASNVGALVLDSVRMSGLNHCVSVNTPTNAIYAAKSMFSYSNKAIYAGPLAPNCQVQLGKCAFAFSGTAGRAIDFNGGTFAMAESLMIEAPSTVGAYLANPTFAIIKNNEYGMMNKLFELGATPAFGEFIGNKKFDSPKSLQLNAASGSLELDPYDFGNSRGVLDLKIHKPDLIGGSKLTLDIFIKKVGVAAWSKYVRRVIPDDIAFEMYHLWGVPLSHDERARLDWSYSGAVAPADITWEVKE